MKTQTMLTTALLFSALVLTGLLLFTSSQPKVVYGDMVASGDDFTLLATSQQVGGEENLITIIDNRSQRTFTYRYHDKRLDGVVSQDLTKFFPAVVAPKP